MQTTKVIDQYDLKETLGKGAFGKVYLGVAKKTGEKFAIKNLNKNKITSREDIDRVHREISIVKKFNHTNVIKTFEISETMNSFFIVMEYCHNGELFDYIVKHQKLGEEEAAYFFYQLIEGLEYIHSLGITHRDIKPENLLLAKGNVLKIIDFGLSNYFRGNLLSTPCGSPCYASPEMVKGDKYNGFKIDVWSTGIVLFALVCGYLPFEDPDNYKLYKKILKCNLEFPSDTPRSAKALIQKILVTNPNERITIQGIKKNSFYLLGKKLFIDKHPNLISSNPIREKQSIILNNLTKDFNLQASLGSSTSHNQSTKDIPKKESVNTISTSSTSKPYSSYKARVGCIGNILETSSGNKKLFNLENLRKTISPRGALNDFNLISKRNKPIITIATSTPSSDISKPKYNYGYYQSSRISTGITSHNLGDCLSIPITYLRTSTYENAKNNDKVGGSGSTTKTINRLRQELTYRKPDELIKNNAKTYYNRINTVENTKSSTNRKSIPYGSNNYTSTEFNLKSTTRPRNSAKPFEQRGLSNPHHHEITKLSTSKKNEDTGKKIIAMFDEMDKKLKDLSNRKSTTKDSALNAISSLAAASLRSNKQQPNIEGLNGKGGVGIGFGGSPSAKVFNLSSKETGSASKGMFRKGTFVNKEPTVTTKIVKNFGFIKLKQGHDGTLSKSYVNNSMFGNDRTSTSGNKSTSPTSSNYISTATTTTENCLKNFKYSRTINNQSQNKSNSGNGTKRFHYDVTFTANNTSSSPIHSNHGVNSNYGSGFQARKNNPLFHSTLIPSRGDEPSFTRTENINHTFVKGMFY